MRLRAVLCVSCLLVLGVAGVEGHTSPPVSVRQLPAGLAALHSRRSLVDRQAPLPPARLEALAQQLPDVGPAAPRPERPWWGWLLLGRLHPIVVHFPIGLLTAAALIEALHVARRRPVPSEAGTYCLVIGIVGGLVSVWFGTLNAAHQSLTGDAALALERHRMMGWTAIVAAAAAFGAGRIARRAPQVRTAVVYVGLVLATGAVVGATGHLGGGLVYGEDYLTGVLPWNQKPEPVRAAAVPAAPAVTPEAGTNGDVAPPPVAPVSPEVAPRSARPAPRIERPAPDPSPSHPPVARGTAAIEPEVSDAALQAAANVDFARDVMPIIEKTCVECHGPDKVKARLRMDSIAALQKGGKSGALFKAGDPENSLIMRRVLGLDGEDQMPLDKDPLTEAQIDTLRRWIAAGASFGAGGSQ